MYKTAYNKQQEMWTVEYKGKLICLIPEWYQEDEILAETIATLLNQNSKIVVNLSI